MTRGFGVLPRRSVRLTRKMEGERQALSHPRLKRLLHKGRPLPKDRFLGTDTAGLSRNSYRHRDRNRDRMAIYSLADAASTAEEKQLALAQANCEGGFRCKLPFCYVCTQIYWKRRRKLLGSLCAGMGRDDLSWGTVLVGISHSGFPSLEHMIREFSEKFHLSLDSLSGVRWSGRFEIDYIDGKLGSAKTYKEQTLAELGYCKDHELAGLLLHVHFVMIHPGLRREHIGYRLRKGFRASRQVRLSALRVTRDLEDSFDALVRYPLKLELGKSVSPERRSKTQAPRRPDIVRFVLRMYRELDGPRKKGLEFDRF
jgi:hypothetical protein